MKNPFQSIIDRKEAEEQRLAEEQRMREERLRQLEESAQKKKGFHIPHPVQAMQNKKEMKTLRKEIAAYEERKKSKKAMAGLVGVMVVCFGILGIMAITEKKEDTKNVPPSTVAVVEQNSESTTVERTIPVASSEGEIETTAKVESASKQEESSSVKETEKATESTSEAETVSATSQESSTAQETTESAELDIPKITAKDLSVSTLNDYGHISTEVLYLGNNEGVTITVKVSVLDLIADDILFLYDENLLSVKEKEPFEVNGKQTYFEYYVTGKKECNTQIAILTTYDYLTQGDDASGFILDVVKMDSSDGKVCYITPTGEKYHFSASCAGENATKTTYRDVIAYDFGPCGKCAK